MWLAGALAHSCSRGDLNARSDCAVAAITAQAREGARSTAKGTRADLKPPQTDLDEGARSPAPLGLPTRRRAGLEPSLERLQRGLGPGFLVSYQDASSR